MNNFIKILFDSGHTSLNIGVVKTFFNFWHQDFSSFLILTPICKYCKFRYFGGHCPPEVEWRAQMTPAFFLQTKKGHGFSRFQRQAECRLRLPKKGRLFVTAATFSPPIVFVWHPHTRSTLRDNRVQRERWGNYTILVLKVANSGLSAPVSTANTCHSYYCKEKKAHSLYYLW